VALISLLGMFLFFPAIGSRGRAAFHKKNFASFVKKILLKK
jgi:hypothetical protein